MSDFSRLYKNGFSVLALAAMSSLANAGSNISFGYSILAAPAPAPVVPAAPVPATSDALLIVLALLLVAIAVRALQSAGGIQKVLSLAVLGGGLILGGMGVENTIATAEILTIPDEGMSCEGGQSNEYWAYHDGTSQVTNNCEDDFTIDSATSEGCPPEGIVIPSATIEAGATVVAPYCFDD